MPNGKHGDSPLSDLTIHDQHPFPPDIEAMLLKIDRLGRAPSRWPLGENWPFSPLEFDWERGEGLDEARRLLTHFIAMLEAGRGDEVMFHPLTQKPIDQTKGSSMPDQLPLGPLGLHEEILLLALGEKTGDVESKSYHQFGVAGGILAELLLQQRIGLGTSKESLVQVRSSQSTGDPVLDDCLERIAKARSPATLGAWAGHFAKLRELKHSVAAQLCRRGILRHKEETVLLLFKREVYPEIDPKPEQEIRERLRLAIFTDSRDVAPKTGMLVSLTDSCGILPLIFDPKELKARKERMEQMRRGELFGQAAREAIDAAIYAMNATISATNATMLMMTVMSADSTPTSSD